MHPYNRSGHSLTDACLHRARDKRLGTVQRRAMQRMKQRSEISDALSRIVLEAIPADHYP